MGMAALVVGLDDTATWFSIVDRVIAHSRALDGLPPSSYALNLHPYLYGMGYPLGSSLPLGIGRALVGVDVAWVFQPYLAFCGARVGVGPARRRPAAHPTRAARSRSPTTRRHA